MKLIAYAAVCVHFIKERDRVHAKKKMQFTKVCNKTKAL